MRARRFKVEFYDLDGVKHSITIDGPVTRDKVAKLLDLVEAMAATPSASAAVLGVSKYKYDRLTSAIISQLKAKEFTSSEAKNVFEATFSEKIPISTVSTYLMRLADRGILERSPHEPVLRYRLKTEEQKQPLPLQPSHPS